MGFKCSIQKSMGTESVEWLRLEVGKSVHVSFFTFTAIDTMLLIGNMDMLQPDNPNNRFSCTFHVAGFGGKKG